MEVMSSCGINVCDVDNDNSSESADVVSTEIVSPPHHQVRLTGLEKCFEKTQVFSSVVGKDLRLKNEDKDDDLKIGPTSRILEDKDFPRGQQHWFLAF